MRVFETISRRDAQGLSMTMASYFKNMLKIFVSGILFSGFN